MAKVTLPNGSIVEMVTGYGPATPITAISNAVSAEVTAANTLAAGDFVEITSGWSNLNNGIFKVGAAPTATKFTLVGVDSSNTLEYVIGVGIGSFRKVISKATIDDVADFDAKGGEPQKGKYQPLSADREIQYRTYRNAYEASFQVGHPIPQAVQSMLKAADLDNVQRGFVVTTKDGTVCMFSATVAMSGMPTMKVNERMTWKVDLSLTSNPLTV
jgi:hypothetical protein